MTKIISIAVVVIAALVALAAKLGVVHVVTHLLAALPLLGMTQAQLVDEKRKARQAKLSARVNAVGGKLGKAKAAKAAKDAKAAIDRANDKDAKMREYLKPLTERNPDLTREALSVIHQIDDEFRGQRESMYNVGEFLTMLERMLEPLDGFADSLPVLAKRWDVTKGHLLNCMGQFRKYNYRLSANITFRGFLFEIWSPGKFNAELMDAVISTIGGIPKSDDKEICYRAAVQFVTEYKKAARELSSASRDSEKPYDEKELKSHVKRYETITTDLLNRGHFRSAKSAIVELWGDIYAKASTSVRESMIRTVLFIAHLDPKVSDATLTAIDRAAASSANEEREKLEAVTKPDAKPTNSTASDAREVAAKKRA